MKKPTGGKAGFGCPECGELANLATATSSFRTPHMVLRGRRCPNGHQFTTMEAPIDDLQWFELERILATLVDVKPVRIHSDPN